MKQVICLMMVVIMATMCCVSIAEDSKSESEECLSQLKLINIYYQMFPDEFGPDYIMPAYLCLMVYMNKEALDMFYMAYSMTKDEEKTAVEYIKDYEVSNMNIVKLATDGYYNWMNGEFTDEQYAKMLMLLVNNILTTK